MAECVCVEKKWLRKEVEKRKFKWKENIKSERRQSMVAWGALEHEAGRHMSTPLVGGPQFEFDDGSCRSLSPIGGTDVPVTSIEE